MNNTNKIDNMISPLSSFSEVDNLFDNTRPYSRSVGANEHRYKHKDRQQLRSRLLSRCQGTFWNIGAEKLLFNEGLKELIDSPQECHEIDGCSSTTNDDIDKLLEAIASNDMLEDLTIRGCNIGFQHISNFCDAISNLNSLISLNIEDNTTFKNSSTKILLDNLLDNLPQLLKLRLWKNHMGPQSGTFLSSYLNQASHLCVLDVSCNNLGSEGVKQIAGVLKNHKSLRLLDVGSNDCGAEGAIALAESLRDNSTLLTLKLYWNNIGDMGAYALSGALVNNEALRKLDVRWNNISRQGMQALNDFVGQSQLESLKIGGEGVSELSILNELIQSKLTESIPTTSTNTRSRTISQLDIIRPGTAPSNKVLEYAYSYPLLHHSESNLSQIDAIRYEELIDQLNNKIEHLESKLVSQSLSSLHDKEGVTLNFSAVKKLLSYGHFACHVTGVKNSNQILPCIVNELFVDTQNVAITTNIDMVQQEMVVDVNHLFLKLDDIMNLIGSHDLNSIDIETNSFIPSSVEDQKLMYSNNKNHEQQQSQQLQQRSHVTSTAASVNRTSISTASANPPSAPPPSSSISSPLIKYNNNDHSTHSLLSLDIVLEENNNSKKSYSPKYHRKHRDRRSWQRKSQSMDFNDPTLRRMSKIADRSFNWIDRNSKTPEKLSTKPSIVNKSPEMVLSKVRQALRHTQHSRHQRKSTLIPTCKCGCDDFQKHVWKTTSLCQKCFHHH